MKHKNNETKRRNIYINNIRNTPFYHDWSSRQLNKGKVFTAGTPEYVLAPLLTLFTIWTLQQAKKDKITKLFFLARDGYPVYRLAKRFCQISNLGIECKYFYCSRYSLRIPMYSENIDEALNHICRGGIDVTYRKILVRSGFSNMMIDNIVKQFPDINFDAVIPYGELKTLRLKLKNSPKYINNLKSVSESKWGPLQAYFKQEGMLDNEHIGIVDSGWTGTTQKTICDIRKRCGCNEDIDGYYFGLYEKPNDTNVHRYHSFYFGQFSHLPNKVMFSNCLYETIFSADHGTTCGYVDKKRIEPVLETYRGDDTHILILNFFEEYGEWFIQENQQIKIEDFTIDTYRKIIQKSLHAFMWNPTLEEAETFGAMHFSDDLLDHTTKEVAPNFSDDILRESHFFNKLLTAYGIRNKYIHESAWYEGSVALNGRNKLIHKTSNSIYKTLSYIYKMLGKG